MSSRLRVEEEYAHTVEAVNLEQELLLVKMQPSGVMGLVRIESYSKDGQPVNSFVSLTGTECSAHYKIGEQEYTIPLGSNMGDNLGADVQAD